MTQQHPAAAAWPPPFSEAFVAEVRSVFADTHHLVVVGPLGSSRGALAKAVASPEAPAAWGRDAHGPGLPRTRYAALNLLMPTLLARPDQPVDDVVAAAGAILDRTFGRQEMILREADLSDDETVEVLARLVEAGRISLVSTLGPAAADTHRLARNAARVDLEPLDETTIGYLLEARFGAPAHPTTVTMLMRRSQGAYAVLQALADAAFGAGQIRVLSGMLVTDAAVSVEAVDDRAAADHTAWVPRFAPDHPARDLIDIAALTLGVQVDDARTACGDEAVDAALAEGVVHLADDLLVFTSQAEAARLRRSLDLDRRTALYERYRDQICRTASVSQTSPLVASWFVSIGRPVSADLAVRATTQANREGRYLHALQFVETIPRAERTSRLLVEQCHALCESGAEAELAELVRSIDASTLHDDDLFMFLRFAVRVLTADEMRALVSGILETADADRRAVLRLAELYAEVYQRGSEDVRRSLRSLAMSGRLGPVNRAMALVAVATSLRHASRATQAVELAGEAVDLLLAAGDAASASAVEAALEVKVLCQVTAIDYDGARETLATYSSSGVDFGNAGRLGTALWALVAFFSGDIRSAMAQAQLCLSRLPASDPHGARGWIEAMAAQILTQVGDIDQVHDLIEASHRRPPHPRLQLDLERRVTQACVHDAIGDPERALDMLHDVVEEARAHDLVLEEVDAAVLSVQIGGPVHLPMLLRAVEDLDEHTGTSIIWRRFAHAIRDNDMRALVALAAELDRDEHRVFAAEVAQFTLDIARRAADMTPEQRQKMVAIADPMQHRHVTRA